jgi:hypothetical protein
MLVFQITIGIAVLVFVSVSVLHSLHFFLLSFTLIEIQILIYDKEGYVGMV